MNSTLTRATYKSLRVLKWHRLIPPSRWGDRLYAHLLCLYFNGYWPRREGGDLTDLVAFQKCSAEIETPLRRQLSDKEELKTVVAQRLGPQHCVPTFQVLHNAQEIDSYTFPERCVIKPTHSSGQIIILQEGQSPNRDTLKRWLSYNHYLKGRERNYLGLTPRVMVEEWIDLSQGTEFKMHCLRGQPLDILMRRGVIRKDSTTYWLDPGGQVRGVTGEPTLEGPNLPANFDQIVQMARVMAQGLVYSRVDILWHPRGVWVGEVTTSPANGRAQYDPGFEQRRGERLFGPQGFNLADFPEL